MTKQEITEAVTEGVRKALEKAANVSDGSQEVSGVSEDAEVKKDASVPETLEITPESVRTMIQETVTKAMEPKAEPEIPMTAEQIQTLIQKSVEAALEPIRQARGLPSNLRSAAEVEKKAEQHYLHGIL